MLLDDFENALKKLEADKMLMAYGDNSVVINNLLAIINNVQGLSNTLKGDRYSDFFKMSITAKNAELERIIVTNGLMRLNERGIPISFDMNMYGGYGYPAQGYGQQPYGGGVPQNFGPSQ